MRSLALLMTALFALSSPSGAEEDPIDALVARLCNSHGMWVNGCYPLLDFDSSASPEPIIRAVLDGYDWARGKDFLMLDQRLVRISPPINEQPFTAVLIDTAAGKKIVLLQYENRSGWWTKVFDTGEL